jgi:hypothetical protein
MALHRSVRTGTEQKAQHPFGTEQTGTALFRNRTKWQSIFSESNKMAQHCFGTEQNGTVPFRNRTKWHSTVSEPSQVKYTNMRATGNVSVTLMHTHEPSLTPTFSQS